MKRLQRILSALICAVLFVTAFSGCNLFTYGGDFVLKADRYSIQPTGTDYPTLFFTDKDGKTIKGTVNVYVDGAKAKKNRVTLTEEKTVAVHAEYNGMKSNTIFIKGEYSSNLPVIIIDTDGKRAVNENYETNGTFYLYDNGSTKRTDYGAGASPTLQSDCTVKIRGQSSVLIYEKKQYKIHLKNSDGSNNNVSLLGMPKENDWIINGTYGDRTVMQNYLVYTLASQMEFAWAPRVRFCEVYITSDRDNMKADDYLGLYVLMESIKVDNNRVDITEGDKSTSPEEIGYLFAKDKGLTSQNTVSTGYDNYELCYPQPEDVTYAQKKYLADKIRTFEDALFGNNFTDPEKGYRAYIDIDSYIDALLLTELTKNVDGMRLSTYFTLDTDGIIRYGPIWDFDISCGTCDYGYSMHLPKYYACLDPDNRAAHDYPWIDRMMQDPWFRNRLVERYEMYRENVFAEENIQGIIDTAYGQVLEVATRNASRWPKLFNGSKVWPNYYKFDTYTEAVNHLKKWLHQRIDWLDKNFESIKELDFGKSG